MQHTSRMILNTHETRLAHTYTWYQKPMGSDEYQFFSEHGIEVVVDDIGSVRGMSHMIHLLLYDRKYHKLQPTNWISCRSNIIYTGEYKYIENTTIPHLALELQSSTRLRNHQLEALAAVFPPTRVPRVALSGVLEMPCGSGKTLTGIAIACKIQKSTLVLCNNRYAPFFLFIFFSTSFYIVLYV